MKKRVAKDGEELLHAVDVHVADEVEGIAPSVGGGSGTNALDIPVGMCQNVADWKPDSVQCLAISFT